MSAGGPAPGASPPFAPPGSIGGLRRLFRAGATPALADLVGRHEAQFVGPWWLRLAAPPGVALLGLRAWFGKEFAAPDEDSTALAGVNLLRRGGALVPTLPMRARLVPSRVDGRPALVVSYPPGARWPWPRVVDELRPVADGTMVGLTFGPVVGLPGGAPFLLRRG